MKTENEDNNLGQDKAGELGKKVLKVLMDQKHTSGEIVANIYALNKALGISKSESDKIQGHMMSSVAAISKIQEKSKSLSQTQSQIAFFTDRIKNIQDNQTTILEAHAQAQGGLYKLEVKRETGLRGVYLSQAAEFKLMVSKGAMTEKDYKKQLENLRIQQDKTGELEDQLQMEEAIAAELLAIKDNSESWGKSINKVFATSKAIANDPKAMGAFMLSEGVKALGKFTAGFEDFKKQGLSAGQAIEAQFKGMDLMSMMGLSDARGVTTAMVQEFGNVNALSRDTTQQLGRMAVEFGISGEEAGALNAAMSTIPGETSESAANAMEMTGHLAEMQGIAPGKIMKDMAKNTEEMARAGSKGAEEFGKSVINLHKMGVEMSTASKIADGLLDFESSITAQMEASVLLGKEINLDKARELALNNDIEGATKEILKNLGSSAEFGKMNRLEQDALANSVGMTTVELTKALDAQEESNKYFGEGASIGMNALGHLTEYGSKAAGFFKENGLLLLATIQFLSMGNGLQMISNSLQMAKNGLLAVGKGIAFATSLIYSSERRAQLAHWVKKNRQWLAEKAHLIWLRTQAAFGVRGEAGRAGALQRVMSRRSGGGGNVVGGLAERGSRGLGAAGDAAKKAPSPQAGVGIRLFLTNLAAGLRSFGTNAGQVLKGVGVLVIAGVMMGAGLAAIALAVNALGGNPMDMVAIGGALVLFAGSLWIMSKALGKIPISSVIQGSLAMVVLGGAMVVAAAAFMMIANVPVENIIAFSIALPLLGLAAAGLGFLMVPIALGAAALALLGVGMVSIGAGLMVMQAGADGLEAFQSLLVTLAESGLGAAVGAFALSGGILALAAASFFAIPGLLLGSWAMAGFAASLALIQPIMEMGGLLALAEGLTSISQLADSLFQVGAAILGIGAGLGLMAYAGLAALPIIGALVGLAAVAPMLSSLGSLFGGGEGNTSEDDQMNTLIDEVRQLRAAFQSPGVINMDGQKVGDVLGLAVSNSGIS